MLLHVKRLGRRATRWLLRNRRTQLDVQENINYFGEGVTQLVEVIPSLMVGVSREYMETLIQSFVEAGLPSNVATRIAGCRAMYTALNIIDVTKQRNFDLVEAAKIFFEVGSQLDLAWFRDELNTSALEDYWDSLARASLRDDIDLEQRALTISILSDQAEGQDLEHRMSCWLSNNQTLLERWTFIINNMRSASNLTFIMFYVAVRELSDITDIILQTVIERCN